MKRCFVDCQKGKITIYPITPKEQEMRLFREEQIASIPFNELFYSSFSVRDGRIDRIARWEPEDPYNVTYENEVNNHNNTFQPEVNYLSGIKFNDDFYNGAVAFDGECDCDRYGNMQIRGLREYLSGLNQNVAFVLDPENYTPTKRFLPTEPHFDANEKRIFRFCIQLTRMAYLLHLLTNDYMQLLDNCSYSEIKKLLSFYTFGDPLELNINELKERDRYFKEIEREMNGHLKETEPFSDKLITKVVYDDDFIEEVKKIALK